MWDSDIGGAVDGVLEPAHIAAFVRRVSSVETARVLIDIQPLSGGLESRAVARVHAESPAPESDARRFTFVVKRLDGPAQRELSVYEFLRAAGARGIPTVLGVHATDPSTSYLFLEWIAASSWPWAEPTAVAQVLDQLAELHSGVAHVALPNALSGWDYESELQTSAGATLETLESALAAEAFAGLGQLIDPLRRVVAALPTMRRQLLSAALPGETVLHGDVHSGNVLMRPGNLQPILIDWGRARLGSPFEDVSSWLESLGYWEPAVRRYRGPLLQHYMRARRVHAVAERELDLWYWLAAASNALAGALRYHLQCGLREAATAGSTKAHSAIRAARDQLRSIERADALWREVVLPQMIVIVKAAQTTRSIDPFDDGQTGVAGAEGFPASSAHALEGTQNLADNPGMGDDHHALATMLTGDAVHRGEDAIAEIAVAFAAGPSEPIIGLPEICAPVAGIASLDFDERHALQVTTVDLAQ